MTAAPEKPPSPAPDTGPDMGPDTGPDSAGTVSAEAPAPEGVVAPSLPEQERMVEALLFSGAEPMTLAQLGERLPQGSDPKQALDLLRARYEGRGVRLVRAGPGWAFRTAPDLGFLMRRDSVESRKLSRAAIETLAIVAYHQPVTRVEIEEIRGVGVSRGTIDRLLELEWIRLGRRRETPGRPVTFVVTPAFLDHFGLESTRDLPGIAELRASGLLDPEPPGFEPHRDESPNDESPGEPDGDELPDMIDSGPDSGDGDPDDLGPEGA